MKRASENSEALFLLLRVVAPYTGSRLQTLVGGLKHEVRMLTDPRELNFEGVFRAEESLNIHTPFNPANFQFPGVLRVACGLHADYSAVFEYGAPNEAEPILVFVRIVVQEPS